MQYKFYVKEMHPVNKNAKALVGKQIQSIEITFADERKKWLLVNCTIQFAFGALQYRHFPIQVDCMEVPEKSDLI